MRLITLSVALLVLGNVLISCSRQNDGRYFPLPAQLQHVIHSESQSFMVDTLLTGLNRPWAMEFLPDNRVLITEREGNILVIENGKLQESPLKGNIPVGLRDIQLHPQYDDNNWIYMSYYVEPTEQKGGYTEIMRGKLIGDRLENEEIIYTTGPFELGGGATGSRIVFDNDGYLFFLVGIRGDRMRAQNMSHHSGKTMRIHDDGSIPSDNPFVGDQESLPEIYSYGHREHQGFVLHPDTGELWATEHGEKNGDELNLIQAGLNYGWPLASWSTEYDGSVLSEDPLLEGTEPPVHYWTPSINPSGLDFVTGERYPGWDGNLFIGSLRPQMLNRSVMEDGKVIHDEKLIEGIGRVRSVRYAPDNFLYLLTEDTGLLVRLIPAE